MNLKAIYNRPLSNQLLSEIATLIRFTIVGLLASLVHIGVAAIVLFYMNEALFLANLIAFIVALNVSFVGHRFFSFKQNGNLGKFFIIALSGFAFNNIILSGLVYFEITGGGGCNNLFYPMRPFYHLFTVSLLGVYIKMKNNNKPCVVTLIIPAYNESESIIDSLKEILKYARTVPDIDYELLLIDDGSNDDTGKKVVFSRTESAITLISFTRNFGKEAAIQAGIKNAIGSAVIIMDADLQHPPELIPEMIRLWRAGMPVIEVVKQDRGQESVLKKMQVKLFYQIFKWFAGVDLKGLSDYKLLDRKVIDLYLKWPEKDRFFRGLISWAQFPSAHLPFKVSHSTRNRSKWSWFKLVRYAINNISNFSAIPLHIFSVVGVIMLMFGISIGAISLYQKLMGHAMGGFTTVNLLIVFIGGTQLLGLGIIGHYIVKIYEEVKGRPSYIISSEVEPSDNDQYS